MTDEFIKEQISKDILSILVHYSGYMISNHELDYGVNLVIRDIIKYTHNSNRYLTGLKHVQVQLKSTTQKMFLLNQRLLNMICK